MMFTFLSKHMFVFWNGQKTTFFIYEFSLIYFPFMRMRLTSVFLSVGLFLLSYFHVATFHQVFGATTDTAPTNCNAENLLTLIVMTKEYAENMWYFCKAV